MLPGDDDFIDEAKRVPSSILDHRTLGRVLWCNILYLDVFGCILAAPNLDRLADLIPFLEISHVSEAKR
jgi:hypothetical protein